MPRPVVEDSGRVSIWTRGGYRILERDGRTGWAVLCLEREFFAVLGWEFTLRPAGQAVALVATDGTVGGLRWWFACPDCGRRCAMLYRPPSRGLYACRRCARVSYRSQREGDADRLYRRAAKLYARVAVKTEHGHHRRRRWTRRHTYRRVMAQARYYDAVSLAIGLRRIVSAAD